MDTPSEKTRQFQKCDRIGVRRGETDLPLVDEERDVCDDVEAHEDGELDAGANAKPSSRHGEALGQQQQQEQERRLAAGLQDPAWEWQWMN